MKMIFEEKTIIVAGASGGIGSAICRLLAELGAKVILMGRNFTKLQQVCGQLHGNGHQCYVCDFALPDSIENVVCTIVSENGPIDGFVHSAGTGAVRPLKLSKYPFMLDVMNINFFSFVELVRCFTKKGRFNPGMNIVGISSVGAQYGRATRTAYAASKGAMDASMRCLAKELGAKGIRVNCVAPGATITNMSEEYKDYAQDTEEYRLNAYRQYLGDCHPCDIANAVIFLLSNQSKMVTGTVLNVDGGKLSN